MLFKKEICITRDISYCNTVVEELNSKGISTFVSTNSFTNLGRYHGIPFNKADYSYEYRINVSWRDYKSAKRVLGL